MKGLAGRRGRRMTTLALCAGMTVAALAPAGAEARSCRPGDTGVTRLSATKVSCSAAKKVVRAYAKRSCAGKKSCRVSAARLRFKCRTRGRAVSCAASRKRSVRWRNPAQPAPPQTDGGEQQPAEPTPAPAPEPQQDPKARFTELLRLSRLGRVYASSSGDSQGNQRYDFCDGGRFTYYAESFSSVSSSTTSANGTWEVTEATFSQDGSQAQARVSYTADNPDHPGGTQGSVVITLIGQNQAFIDFTEYHRTPGGAQTC